MEREELIREIVRRAVVETRRRMIAVVSGDEEPRLVTPDILAGITQEERATLGVRADAWGSTERCATRASDRERCELPVGHEGAHQALGGRLTWQAVSQRDLDALADLELPPVSEKRG